jgi:hypothetical protein
VGHNLSAGLRSIDLLHQARFATRQRQHRAGEIHHNVANWVQGSPAGDYIHPDAPSVGPLGSGMAATVAPAAPIPSRGLAHSIQAADRSCMTGLMRLYTPPVVDGVGVTEPVADLHQ